MQPFEIDTKGSSTNQTICVTVRHADVAAREVSVWTGEGSSGGTPHEVRSRQFSAVDSQGTYIDEKTLAQQSLGYVQLAFFALCPPPALLLSPTPVLDRSVGAESHRISKGDHVWGVR